MRAHKQTIRSEEQTDAKLVWKWMYNPVNIFWQIYSITGLLFTGREIKRNLHDYFTSLARKNMTYPHFQRKQAKHLTQQRARRHLWTANPAVVFPPPVTGRWFTRPARLHLGTVCTGAYSLPAQTEGGENTTFCTALWPANAADKIMWPVSRCIIPSQGVTIHKFE